MLTINLKDLLKENKLKKQDVILDFVLNSEFMKKTQEERKNILRDLENVKAPFREDRNEKVLGLYNRCKESNSFYIYDNLDYICKVLSYENEILYIYNEYKSSAIIPFTRSELLDYDNKLLNTIEKESGGITSTQKVVLGLSNKMAGKVWWIQNGLFPNVSKVIFKNRVVYFAIVDKNREEEIHAWRFKEFNFF